MTTNKLFTSVILVAIAAVMSFSFNSCKKDDKDVIDSAPGHLHIYYQNVMGSMDVMYNHTHSLADGRKYSFEQVYYYVSNIRLQKADGSEYAVDGIYEIASGGNQLEIELEDVPAGDYTGFNFYVGIDSATNHLDPSTYAASSALSPQTPNMFWTWNSGYIFMRLQGSVDTLATPSATAPEFGDFAFHLGGDNYLVDVPLTKSFTVSSSAHPALNVTMDAEYLIENNMDLSADRVTHTMDNMPLAMKLKNNITAAFSVE